MGFIGARITISCFEQFTTMVGQEGLIAMRAQVQRAYKPAVTIILICVDPKFVRFQRMLADRADGRFLVMPFVLAGGFRIKRKFSFDLHR